MDILDIIVSIATLIITETTVTMVGTEIRTLHTTDLDVQTIIMVATSMVAISTAITTGAIMGTVTATTTGRGATNRAIQTVV